MAIPQEIKNRTTGGSSNPTCGYKEMVIFTVGSRNQVCPPVADSSDLWAELMGRSAQRRTVSCLASKR